MIHFIFSGLNHTSHFTLLLNFETFGKEQIFNHIPAHS
mgnify:CR=1 FL=1